MRTVDKNLGAIRSHIARIWVFTSQHLLTFHVFNTFQQGVPTSPHITNRSQQKRLLASQLVSYESSKGETDAQFW